MTHFRSAVVLLSGGLDSGVAMALWLEANNTVALCLTADYGQRSVARETAAAQGLARRYGVPWRSLPLPWLGDLATRAGSALMAGGGALPTPAAEGEPGDVASAAAVWVPARNVVLLAAAAAEAEVLGADCVVAGFNREEARTFPDNSEDFVDAMRRSLVLGTRRGVGVESPTQRLDKREIVRAARRLGLGAEEFWSCYAGGEVPCGGCESCVRSVRAWGDG